MSKVADLINSHWKYLFKSDELKRIEYSASQSTYIVLRDQSGVSLGVVIDRIRLSIN